MDSLSMTVLSNKKLEKYAKRDSTGKNKGRFMPSENQTKAQMLKNERKARNDGLRTIKKSVIVNLTKWGEEPVLAKLEELYIIVIKKLNFLFP